MKQRKKWFILGCGLVGCLGVFGLVFAGMAFFGFPVDMFGSGIKQVGPAPIVSAHTTIVPTSLTEGEAVQLAGEQVKGVAPWLEGSLPSTVEQVDFGTYPGYRVTYEFQSPVSGAEGIALPQVYIINVNSMTEEVTIAVSR